MDKDSPSQLVIQDLLRSNEVWRAIAENPFDYVMLVDRDGVYQYINHTAPGLHVDDLIGKVTLLEFIAPEDRPTVQSALRNAFERAESTFYEVRVPVNERWYASVMAPVMRDGVVVAASLMSRDCTQQKLAEHASRQADARYRMIVESTRDGIWVLDREARTSFVNGRMADMLGYAPAEMLGRSLMEFIEEPRRPAAITNFARRLDGQHQVHDFCFQRKDGSPLWALISGSPTRDAQGQVAGAIAIVSDQTERRRWAESVAQSQKLEAVGRLAGGIAHEFNNLLASIVGFGSLLERSLDAGSKARSDVEHILDAADRASGLVRQLLTFARKQAVHPRVVNLNELLQKMRPMLQSLMPDDVGLVLRLGPSPRMVCVDPGQFEQVVLNLVINARDAISAQGRVVISLEREDDDASGDAVPHPRVAVKVSDNGCGIEDSVLDHIFEPFFTTKGADRGSGLGLSIVYSIVQQNGGSVSVQSARDQGTAFTLRFPEVAEMNAALTAAQSHDPMGGSERVLLVEDDPLVRSSTQRMLQSLGYEVLVAAHGSEALTLSLSREGRLSAVVSDVIMPEMNGPELVERLRRARPSLRVLFLSGHSEAMRADRGLKTHFPVLEKPFTMARLAQALRSTLDGPV